MSHTKPTSIQSSAIPAIMNNSNVLVKAETGSGKTLTYLIPIVSRLLDLDTVDRTQGSYALVIAPTRELVLQIYEVLSQLVKAFPWIVVGHIIGGEKKKSEKSRIRKGITILIATPGRLLDHLQNTNAFKLNFLKWLVFDEADRLLDMGFEREVTQIMKLLNEKALNEQNPIPRQNLLLSATLSKALSNLASVNLEKPVFIGLDSAVEEKEDNERNYNTHKIPDTLNQFFITTPMKKKLILLATFLRWKVKEEKDCKIIVFFSNCDSVEYFFTLFSAIQTPTLPPHMVKKGQEEYESLVPTQLFKLHGNMAQNTRTPTFHTFRNSNSAVLFCTDVAARGLDLPHVNWIVQYDPPSDPRAYIHRVGRTARIGQSGNAVVFITPQEKSYIQVLNSKNMFLEEMPFESVVAHLKTNFEKNLQNDPEVEMGALQFRFQFAVQKTDKDVDFQAMAVLAFQSFVRSYATHTKSTRHIFDMKNLHLGHLAKAFALQDPPSSFLHVNREPKKKKDNKRKMVTTFSQSSEFSDGLN
uniref:ATP-dependent RNA helicase n=1 Tax=Arcella intermedia TaxID=1963864 RepID=A0A6B2L144_9EUKA